MLENTPSAPSSLTLPSWTQSDLLPSRPAFRLHWLPSTFNALSLPLPPCLSSTMHSAECCHCIPKSKFTPSLSSNLAALFALNTLSDYAFPDKAAQFGSDYLASDTPATALFKPPRHSDKGPSDKRHASTKDSIQHLLSGNGFVFALLGPFWIFITHNGF